MRAVVHDRYGPPDVLRIEEIEAPVPRDDEILVEIRAATGKLGADPVIDYTQEDFRTNGETYDVIFDAVGKQSFRRCMGSLKPGGRYLATDGLGNIALAQWTSRFGDKKVVFPIPPRYTKKDVLFLEELVETGKYRPVIDRVYPMEQVIEASQYVETEQKTGNVVLTIARG